MKNTIMSIAILAITLAACNNESSTAKKENTETNYNNQANTTTMEADNSANNSNGNAEGIMSEMVNDYLQIKNALAGDNGKKAADAGNSFVTAISKMDTNSFTAESQKVWDNISGDAKEMAEHIGENAGKIEHQREHFEMLSKDMYDLVKTFGSGQDLYLDYCPMYNNNKGATWLSETKDIKNPYLGKKMPTCGNVKEAIKP